MFLPNQAGLFNAIFNATTQLEEHYKTGNHSNAVHARHASTLSHKDLTIGLSVGFGALAIVGGLVLYATWECQGSAKKQSVKNSFESGSV